MNRYLNKRIHFKGYKDEAFRRGGVPAFFEAEGVVKQFGQDFYIVFDDGYNYPLKYVENVEIIGEN